MSILDPVSQPVVSQADQVAARLRQQTVLMHESMVRAFNDSSRSFWANSAAPPADIAASLGTDAAEMFALHAKLGALLAEISPGAIAEGAAMVGAFTVNGDGTVTVHPLTDPV